MESTVKCLGAGRSNAGPDWYMRAHSHREHELIAVIRGAQWTRIQGRRIVAQAGDVLFYPAGVAHEEGVERAPLETIFISFQWDGFCRGMPLQVPDAKGRIRALVEWLYAEREAYFAGAEAFRDALLQPLVAEYLRLAVDREDAAVERARAYVRGHLESVFDLDDLAAEAGLSKYHFVRRYRELTGLTPMADARRIRLEAARQLLLTTNLPLKAVAERVGIANEYHLSRLLKSHFGVRARDLRRLVHARPASAR